MSIVPPHVAGDSHSRRRAPSHPPTQTPSSPHSCVHSEPPPSPPSAHHPSNPLRDASAGEGEGGGERGLKTTRLVRVRVKFQRKEAAMMELVVPRHDDCAFCVCQILSLSPTPPLSLSPSFSRALPLSLSPSLPLSLSPSLPLFLRPSFPVSHSL